MEEKKREMYSRGYSNANESFGEVSSMVSSPMSRSPQQSIDHDGKNSRSRTYLFRKSGDLDDIIATCTRRLEVNYY